MCGWGVDSTRWVGASGLHGTESRASNDLERVCIETVQYSRRGPGEGGLVSTSPLSFFRHSIARLKKKGVEF